MWVSKLVPSGLFGSSMNDNHGTIVPHYCRIRVTEKCLNCSSTTHSLSDNDRSCAPATARREIPRRLWGRRQSMYQRNSPHHVRVKKAFHMRSFIISLFLTAPCGDRSSSSCLHASITTFLPFYTRPAVSSSPGSPEFSSFPKHTSIVKKLINCTANLTHYFHHKSNGYFHYGMRPPH